LIAAVVVGVAGGLLGRAGFPAVRPSYAGTSIECKQVVDKFKNTSAIREFVFPVA
jgi:hypothetical protein